MSKSHIQLHPNSRSKHSHNKHNLKKLDKLAQKYSWVVIALFAISTVVLLSLVIGDVRNNVGQAALNLSGYNSWKTAFGLNPNVADANFNLSGDGITNYNKFTLNQSLSTVTDGSVIPDAGVSSTNNSSLPTVSAPITVATRTLEATAPSISANSPTSTTNTTVPTVGSSTSLTPSALNPSGPAISNPTPSTVTTTTSPNTTTTTVTNPTGTGGSTAIPLPIPGTGSSSIVASTVNPSTGTTNKGTSATSVATQNNPTVATSGASINSTTTANSVSNLATETVRTGGETDFIIFTSALISLFTGIYLLKNKFTKNSLAVHQGEKSGN